MSVNVCPDDIFSVCPIVSAQYPLNFSTFFFMVVCYREAMCHPEKLVVYFECQGHSEGVYNQYMTVFTLSSKLLVHLQKKLGMIVQHHKPECLVEKWDYCIQGQGHSKSSKY